MFNQIRNFGPEILSPYNKQSRNIGITNMLVLLIENMRNLEKEMADMILLTQILCVDPYK